MMSAKEWLADDSHCWQGTHDAMEQYAAYVNKELVKTLEQVAALGYDLAPNGEKP